MKRKSIFAILIILVFSIFNVQEKIYSSSIFDIFIQNNNNSSMIECPYCHHMNPANAKYCSQCGRALTHPNNYYGYNNYLTVRCPYCYRIFKCNETNSQYICQNCRSINPSENIYCNNCGVKINTNLFWVTCPYCHKNFEAKFYNNSPSYILCPYCGKWYMSNQKYCPYCSSLNNDKNINNMDSSKNINSNIVKIDSFTKSNYKKEVKKYSISSITSNRSFTKVIINNHTTQRYAVIVNTIKVWVNGGWQDYPIAKRLSEGNNAFNISIPKGARYLLISFSHGQGAQVSVYLQ